MKFSLHPPLPVQLRCRRGGPESPEHHARRVHVRKCIPTEQMRTQKSYLGNIQSYPGNEAAQIKGLCQMLLPCSQCHSQRPGAKREHGRQYQKAAVPMGQPSKKSY